MGNRRLLLPGKWRLLWLLLPFLLTAALLANCRRSEPTPPNPVVPGVVKIPIRANGFYRFTLDDLQEAGLGGPLSQENIYLSQGETAVPYLLDGDSLIFYGRASTSRYTATRPYLLATGRPGLLMATAEVGPAGSAAGQTVSQTLHLEENHIYDSRARSEANEEPWFWETIQVQNRLPLAFDLPAVADEPATIRLALWGASHNPGVENDHDIDLLLNEQTLATVRWDGESHFVGEVAVPAGALRQGENSLVLDNSVEGATLVDISRLDWLEIIYASPAEAVGDVLAFSGGQTAVAAAGFSGRPYVFDATDPAAPVQLTGWQYEAGRLQLAAAPGQQIVAVGPDGLREPEGITGLRQSNWRDPAQQADLLIITTDEFIPALAPLVAARQTQGLSVALLPAAEIYDEFGYGEDSPDSIRAFVAYAYQEWAEPKPRYLLLVGDATYDYRGYETDVSPDWLPSLLTPVEYSGETVSDARLADVSGDARPELAVGRWPVSEVEQVEQLVARTLAYEQGEAPSQAVFSADGTSPEFGMMTDTIIQTTAFPTAQVSKLYGRPAADMLQAWAAGAWLVTYTGHGSLDRWGREDVFSVEAVPDLRSAGSPPIVVQLTCLTGFFAHPTTTSLSEAMLLHEEGPVLLIAATSLTLSSSQEPFAVALLNQLQNPAVERIGDALQAAKLSLDVAGSDHLREISDTFGLLGDPSTIIQRPSGS